MAIPQDEIITYHKPNIFGQFFRCSRRTGAWLDFLQEELPPGHELRIIQGCFNTTVLASAGTHDYDAVVDCYITGFTWEGMQRFIRKFGGFAWHREPPTFTNHIHTGVLGYRIRVGIFVPGQKDDYLAHPPRSGLAGHVVDPTWHPDPQFVFDYTKYIKGEYGTKPSLPQPPEGDFTMADINDLLQHKILPDGTTVIQSFRDSHAARTDLERFIEAEMRRDVREAARQKLILKRLAAVRKAVAAADDSADVAALRAKVVAELNDLESGLTEIQEATALPAEEPAPEQP